MMIICELLNCDQLSECLSVFGPDFGITNYNNILLLKNDIALEEVDT